MPGIVVCAQARGSKTRGRVSHPVARGSLTSEWGEPARELHRVVRARCSEWTRAQRVTGARVGDGRTSIDGA